MKKILKLALLASAITLVSCGRSGWKCTNHYGKTEKPGMKSSLPIKKIKKFAS
ncbi:hypothetical protein [Flavobacterium sp. 3HN19-14]|uniref:hypothetical protein n=1 Tax=Flavobacterium sp. 3HN19-14 TaxID=3448133 RepID=UPI003EDFA23D